MFTKLTLVRIDDVVAAAEVPAVAVVVAVVASRSVDEMMVVDEFALAQLMGAPHDPPPPTRLTKLHPTHGAHVAPDFGSILSVRSGRRGGGKVRPWRGGGQHVAETDVE